MESSYYDGADNASSWFTEDEYDKEYYLGQFKKVYRSIY